MSEFAARVYYEDTDAAGVMHHAAYVRFFERGRSEWLRRLGFAQRDIAAGADGVLFAVRRIAVEYEKPAALDDELRVITAPRERRRASLSFAQALLRGGETLATAEVLVVCVRAMPFRAAPLPPALAAAVDADIKAAPPAV